MVIYLDGYRIAKAARDAAQKRAEAACMWVDCGPLVALAAHFGCPPQHEMDPQLPNDLTPAERGPFLDLVYAIASRI